MRFARVAMVPLLLIGALAFGASTLAQSDSDFRLPTHITPSNYHLTVTPYLTPETGKELFTFDGIAIITLATSATGVTSLVLHQRDLTITKIYLKQVNTAQQYEPTVANYNETTHKLRINLAGQTLTPGQNYELRFEYTGKLNSDMYGFYRSSYVEKNVTKWAATTQMQATHARRVLPCFDEPAFKATFDVVIYRPASFQPSVSNGILKTTESPSNNRVRETFATTPIMSTYLLAFIVSEFTVRESADKKFAVLARPEAYAQTEYALRIGQDLLAKLDAWTAYGYFSVPGVDKMHLAALPDFSAGAMENWGLLTYRETALLYQDKESTALSQQRIAAIIAHEQAHMWFGDLVTCEWWSYTWLNEGFARYFQYFGTALSAADWALEEQFLVEQVHAALNYDSVPTSKSLNHDVNTPEEVSDKFDSISYNKGASVLRMIEHLLGKKEFQAAIRQYLKDNAFKTTSPARLFQALQQQAGKLIISDIVSPWIQQRGYPVVHVQRNPTNTTYRQELFNLKGPNSADSTIVWPIPINSASSANINGFQQTASPLLFKEKSLLVSVPERAAWEVLNVQQTGFYRVNYDETSWQNLTKALKAANHSGIHLLNRAQIIDDLLNLARAEYVKYPLALGAVQYLETEDQYIPWLTAINNLAYVQHRLSGNDLAIYKKYIIHISEHAYKTLTFGARNNDTRTDIYNRANLLSLRCKFDNKACLEDAAKQFKQLRDNSNYVVPADVRSVVYCTAIAQGNQTVWDLFWNRFRTSNLASEQVLILSALGCTTNNATLIGYLEKIIGAEVRLQDKAAAFAAAYGQQPQSVQLVLDFVTAHHERVRTAFGATAPVSRILSAVAARITNKTQVDKLKAFSASVPAYAESLKQDIADAEFNLRWAEKHGPAIVKYMKENGAASMTSAVVLVIVAALLAIFH